MSIQTRLFLGYVQNKEIKMHLHRSASWREAKIMGQAPLTETVWQGKEYIGLFTPSPLTLAQLKEKERDIKNQLQIYCPKLNLARYSPSLLSQLFLF